MSSERWRSRMCRSRELRCSRIRGFAIRFSLSPNQMPHHWLTDWLTIQRWSQTQSLCKASCQLQLYDQTETKLKPSIRLNCVYNARGLLFWKEEIQEIVNAGTSPVTDFPRRVYSRSSAAHTGVQVRTMLLSCWELSRCHVLQTTVTVNLVPVVWETVLKQHFIGMWKCFSHCPDCGVLYSVVF